MDPLITGYLEKIHELLSRIDEKLESGRAMPFSSRVSIDKNDIYDIVDEIRDITVEMKRGFPSELNSAIRVLGDKDRILEDANAQKERIIAEAKGTAEMILKAAESEKVRILDEHDITAEARQLSRSMISDANDEIMASKQSAAQFFNEIFVDVENMVQEALNTQRAATRNIEHQYNEVLADLHENRRNLQLND